MISCESFGCVSVHALSVCVRVCVFKLTYPGTTPPTSSGQSRDLRHPQTFCRRVNLALWWTAVAWAPSATVARKHQRLEGLVQDDKVIYTRIFVNQSPSGWMHRWAGREWRHGDNKAIYFIRSVTAGWMYLRQLLWHSKTETFNSAKKSIMQILGFRCLFESISWLHLSLVSQLKYRFLKAILPSLRMWPTRTGARFF